MWDRVTNTGPEVALALAARGAAQEPKPAGGAALDQILIATGGAAVRSSPPRCCCSAGGTARAGSRS
ncbi:hypothetical protein ACSNOI_23675 [Actinomadura kijaniata]|uniref:hypothetical protein n=1 Tax=Actinomadura kijaniata TaxID=46161 RepID=UPI003F1DB8FF